jgi:aspartate kinase
MAATLREIGLKSVAVEATDVIVTDDQYLQAEPMMDRVKERSMRLRPLLEDGVTPVVTGFIGTTVDGVLNTGSRLGLLCHDARRGTRGSNNHLDGC